MNCLSFKTKFGWIGAFEKKNKIVMVKFGKYHNKSVSKNLKKLRSNIFNFFNKKNQKINSKIHISGNLIQKKIWRQLTKIQYGSTKSYGQIAKKFKLSPRHVGKICGQNKIALIIPCHRVIRSDGGLGGYSGPGGIRQKIRLLRSEKIKI